MKFSDDSLVISAKHIQEFAPLGLSRRVAELEISFTSPGVGSHVSMELCAKSNVNIDLLRSALHLKNIAGQINEVVHAVGILLLLPHILEPKEVVTQLSLAAGNTGRAFDLETNLRVAEFKFIHWKGGSESIRQNSLFKDFFNLAEFETSKRRYLYVIDDHFPRKFLNARRALNSVMSKDHSLSERFATLYGSRFTVVHEYYRFRHDRVEIVDIRTLVPDFDLLSGFDLPETGQSSIES